MLRLWDNRLALPPFFIRVWQSAKRRTRQKKMTVCAIPACNVQMAPDHPVNAPGVYCCSGEFCGSFFFFSAKEGKIVMGRDPSCCNVVFSSSAKDIGARHCELIWDQSSQSMICRNLSSSHGARLYDGRCLAAGEMAVLRDGQVFEIGGSNRFMLRISKGG